MRVDRARLGVYHTQLENDWIRLVRVRYPANSKIPLHGHPSTVTAYVYLSESSPVRFTHQGSRTHVVTRQPTTPASACRAGATKVTRRRTLDRLPATTCEWSSRPSPAGGRSPFYRDNRPLAAAPKTTTSASRTRRCASPAWRFRPARPQIATADRAPALLVALGEATLTADGAALALKAGQERWVAASRKEQPANAGEAQIELLRIDVLTAPDSSR